MDILHLVDRLEEVLNQSRSFWFTSQVVVDEDRNNYQGTFQLIHD